MINTVLKGDCLEVLKTLEENSVDSIVTDPPYELGFMGKSWDSTGIANNVEMWKEAVRVLKPGGHLLAFSGTRTYHRMASAIEDAGFEVRDMIEWVYGSGFPKSLNIGKAVDKLQGNKREDLGKSDNWRPAKTKGGAGFDKLGSGEVDIRQTKGTSEWEGWGTALKPAHEPICMARKPLAEKTVAENVLKYGTGGINIDESRVEIPEGDDSGWSGSHAVPPAGSSTDAFGVHKFKEVIRDKPEGGRFPANLIHDNSEEVKECFPETGSPRKARTSKRGGSSLYGSETIGTPDKEGTWPEDNGGNASRFFKSIPIEEQDEIQEECTDMEEKLERLQQNEMFLDKIIADAKAKGWKDPYENKSIIYQAKASKSERNKGCEELEDSIGGGMNGTKNQTLLTGSGNIGNNITKNNHPTVKPIALMEYLIKMVTPTGGIVLDPFTGSGSTLVAAKHNGYQYIGIEKEQEYIDIINKRLNHVDN